MFAFLSNPDHFMTTPFSVSSFARSLMEHVKKATRMLGMAVANYVYILTLILMTIAHVIEYVQNVTQESTCQPIARTLRIQFASGNPPFYIRLCYALFTWGAQRGQWSSITISHNDHYPPLIVARHVLLAHMKRHLAQT